MRNISLWVVGALCLSLALIGCEDKGPAEKAGEAIDKAVEDVGDAVKDATN